MADAMRDVLDVVARHFDVSIDDIKSQRRTRHVLPARHVSAYLAQRVSGLSMQEIGNRLGGRDQTYIVMYCRAITRRAEEDETFSRLLRELEEAVRGRDD